MAKVDFLTAKIAQRKSLPDEYFDNLIGPPVGMFFTPDEQSYVKRLILKNRGDIKMKLLNAFMINIYSKSPFPTLNDFYFQRSPIYQNNF